jgi:hypothetical protein
MLYAPERLKIPLAKRETAVEGVHGRPRQSGLLKALGAIVCQAMHDGMLSVRIGADPESGEPCMYYYGPVGAEEPRWWDMTPPPLSAYLQMLTWVFWLAETEPSFPTIRGKIPAVKQGRRLDLDLEIDGIYSVKISWPEQEVGRLSQRELSAE